LSPNHLYVLLLLVPYRRLKGGVGGSSAADDGR
jgi:hypothetical protein